MSNVTSQVGQPYLSRYQFSKFIQREVVYYIYESSGNCSSHVLPLSILVQAALHTQSVPQSITQTPMRMSLQTFCVKDDCEMRWKPRNISLLNLWHMPPLNLIKYCLLGHFHLVISAEKLRYHMLTEKPCFFLDVCWTLRRVGRASPIIYLRTRLPIPSHSRL